MGGVRHKLPLLLPGHVHGPDRPAGQQQAEAQEGQETGAADKKAGLDQTLHSGQLAGCVGKNQDRPLRRPGQAEAQARLPQQARRLPCGQGRIQHLA